MLTILSPAKTLDFSSQYAETSTYVPYFLNQANQIAAIMAKLSNTELAALLNISPKLAQLNTERYAQWGHAPERPAVFAFNGDVYEGLKASTLSNEDLYFAQTHFGILSGLYGLLQPLDIIKPHRLEMGTRLPVAKNKDLYAFWKEKVTKLLNKKINLSGTKFLINLASQEYYSAIDVSKIKAEIITPVFKDYKNGKYIVISFFAKKARGLMSRYIIQNQINEPNLLQGFDDGGYIFNHQLTKGNEWVFTRG